MFWVNFFRLFFILYHAEPTVNSNFSPCSSIGLKTTIDANNNTAINANNNTSTVQLDGITDLLNQNFVKGTRGNDDNNDGSDSDAGARCSQQQNSDQKSVWNRQSVLKLIHFHTEFEPLFCKVGYKKKTAWQKISSVMISAGYQFSHAQCEQKWKNLTKAYRDAVDYNAKSGNDRKSVRECLYFAELQDAYGYRPNVKPTFLMGSNTGESSTAISSDNDCGSDNRPQHSNSSSSAGSPVENKASKRDLPYTSKRAKSRKTSDELITILKDIHQDIKEDQKVFLEHIDQQHKDRMQKEKREKK